MRTVRLTVAYDGTAFHGWQVQPRERTVQGVLGEALRQVLGVDEMKLPGAGRTDAGVHARGQVASFELAGTLPVKALPHLLNRRLPDDLRVRDAREAPRGFHARHSARGRRYAYRLLREPDVLMGRIAWAPPGGYDAAGLARATRVLEREADFSAFRATGSTPSPPTCRVRAAHWSAWEGGVRLDIVADRFLYHMVRNVVGTALAAAASADPAGVMAEVLASRDRARGGVTVPARGLCLEEVFYDAEEAS